MSDHTFNAAQPAPDWQDDPVADERWNAGCDFAMEQLCNFLGVDATQVTWDAATETVDGDVQAVIGNILRAKFGEDWGPEDHAQCSAATGELPAWEDPRVQIVYEALCDADLNEPPNPEEHWEGWVSRNIVKRLMPHQPQGASDWRDIRLAAIEECRAAAFDAYGTIATGDYVLTGPAGIARAMLNAIDGLRMSSQLTRPESK